MENRAAIKLASLRFENQKLPTFSFRIQVTKHADMTVYPSQRMLILLEVFTKMTNKMQLRSLSYDRSKASSKASSPHSAI